MCGIFLLKGKNWAHDWSLIYAIMLLIIGFIAIPGTLIALADGNTSTNESAIFFIIVIFGFAVAPIVTIIALLDKSSKEFFKNKLTTL